MRLLIVAAGSLPVGPEALLIAGALAHAAAAGPRQGFSAVELLEIQVRPPGGPRAEAAELFRTLPDDARIVLLDERGENWGTRQLAERLAQWRDANTGCVAFVIGGKDGVAQSVRDQATEKLAFGRQSWPESLVRVMLAEQLDRALAMLDGDSHPEPGVGEHG